MREQRKKRQKPSELVSASATFTSLSLFKSLRLYRRHALYSEWNKINSKICHISVVNIIKQAKREPKILQWHGNSWPRYSGRSLSYYKVCWSEALRKDTYVGPPLHSTSSWSFLHPLPFSDAPCVLVSMILAILCPAWCTHLCSQTLRVILGLIS